MMRWVSRIGTKMYSPVEDIFPIQRDIDDHIDKFEQYDLV